MKFLIEQKGNEYFNTSRRKFCLFPIIALDPKPNPGIYIVWWEWVTWKKGLNQWIIEY